MRLRDNCQTIARQLSQHQQTALPAIRLVLSRENEAQEHKFSTNVLPIRGKIPKFAIVHFQDAHILFAQLSSTNYHLDTEIFRAIINNKELRLTGADFSICC